ncbi:MAG: hypothetical protein K0R14_102 [Burkholderiales bacterium]|jgi:hypothetical protein|nr:hypothetical protein [Burkholderiales bacterium]
MKSAIVFILHNFPLVMLLLSIFIAFAKSGNFFNRLCFAVLFFTVGFSGIWGFIFHVFYPDITSAYIGWQTNPFEYEIGVANLAIGITGIIASFASNGYKKATATFVSIFLIGAAIGHIHQMIILKNFHPGNVGLILFTDILIPIVVWFAVLCTREKQPNQINWAEH